VDIEISYTGLRVGEKLYEEKLMSEEGLRTTPNKLIHIGSPIPFDADLFISQIQMLMDAAYDGREEEMRQLVAEVVSTYHPESVKDDAHQVKAYQ
jgi:FlaA1/EpsC-like NDP-sugar epimerase